MTDEEKAVIMHWLETRFKDLYGRNNSSSVSADKDEAWSDFVKAVNEVHNYKFNRTRLEIEKRIDNFKTNGNYCNCLHTTLLKNQNIVNETKIVIFIKVNLSSDGSRHNIYSKRLFRSVWGMFNM